MTDSTLHRRNFLLHLRERPGFDGPVLLKEPVREPPSRFHAEQLHNEYAITCQLADVTGVRPALAKEGTESQPVLLLEYIEGQSLAELMRSASLDLTEKLRLAANVAQILSHLHDHQVVHKDLNSSNILIATDDSAGSRDGIYIIDFGISLAAGKESPALLAADDNLMGTLAYISPEQTGRMNRRVDHRTDLYSLGVTLYELFTGQLPFDRSDVLELIHDHIARQPTPPSEIEPDIPGPVSDIVLKLLAKDADDRYQTARGLQADLKRCLSQWQERGRIEPFDLGSDDFSGRLQVPQRLYGRQAEIEYLRDTLDRALTEQSQLLFVAGKPGVGKTSLVREIQRDVIERQGIFIEGKFDQLQRARPYSGWEQALTGLVDRWLAQSESVLAYRRDSILDAVGGYGQLLIDVIPALERVLGPQPEVPQLGSVESQNRFNHFFSRSIACLAGPSHPLVVFLDDLQWIDLASLSLLEAVVEGQSTSGLLIISAYRSNEVGALHPVAIGQDRMQAETERVSVLTLKELSPEDINYLLADCLQVGADECRNLGKVLSEKTSCNPFFFQQLLLALESKELLRFDSRKGHWRWEQGLIDDYPAGSNVVELLIEAIQALPAETRNALSLGACLGSEFAVDTLTTLTGQANTAVLAALGPALAGGLIIRSNGRISFTHDRVQEAGYALIPEADRPRTHLEIGRALMAATATEELEGMIFDVVGHLNAGRALIETSSGQMDLARLNQRAGQRARAASAFAEAKIYVEIGLELLGQDAWQDHYELALALHNEDAELALMTGQTDYVSKSTELIYANAGDTTDLLRACVAQIEAENSRYEPARALEIGLGFLENLGVRMPAHSASSDSRRLHQDLLDLLTVTPLEAISELPEMTDERALAASSVLAAMSPAAYIVDPPLVSIINYEGARLTSEFGHNTWSALFYSRLALVAFSAVRNESPDNELHDSVVLAGQMRSIALELLEIPTTAPSRTKVLHILALIAHWSEPIDKALDLADAAHESRVETGDLLNSAFGCLHTANHGLAAGLRLDGYRRLVDGHVQFCDRLGQRAVSQWLSIFLQTVQRLETTSPEPHRLIGTFFNEDDWLPKAEAAGDLPGRHFLSVLKLLLSYQFDVESALDPCVLRSEEFLAGGAGMVSYAIFHFYSALARLRLADQLTENERAEALKFVDDSLRLMKLWSETTPSTFQHKADLIAAEKSRVVGDFEGALSQYECAIEGARTSGFTHEEALANELYARFWTNRGHDRFAGLLMREAQSLYLKWGAAAKAEHLTQRYPNLLAGLSVDSERSGTQGTSGLIPSELDLRTVLKASQDIATNIDLDSLLAKLMSDAIENTGAQSGYLILKREGRWSIEARASVDDPGSFSRATDDIAGTDLLAEGVVHYVARKQETVVLDDAFRTGEFADHEYIRTHRARSILCVPLVNQGRTSAVVYLENNLAPGVFTPQRVGLLQLLSSQMAISIDNARTHADLEELLEIRSRALASAETQIRTLFENSPLGIALSSPEGRFLSVNRAVLEMLHVRQEELTEHSVMDFYQDPADREALLRRVMESGAAQDFGVQVVRLDGSRFHANLNVSRLDLDGSEVLLTMIQDVTSQITAEQEAAALEERARLARELHDAVSQTVLSASLLADATLRSAEQGHSVETRDLTRLGSMLHGALDEMRTLLLEMRPTAVRNKTLGQLLTPVVKAAQARSSGEVNLRVAGDRILPEAVSAHLQRIAQESLNNAILHSHAKTIAVELVCEPDGVALRITDDGRGFDIDKLAAGHHGLDIMRERAQEIGAVLKIRSAIDEGAEVIITWS